MGTTVLQAKQMYGFTLIFRKGLKAKVMESFISAQQHVNEVCTTQMQCHIHVS